MTINNDLCTIRFPGMRVATYNTQTNLKQTCSSKLWQPRTWNVPELCNTHSGETTIKITETQYFAGYKKMTVFANKNTVTRFLFIIS